MGDLPPDILGATSLLPTKRSLVFAKHKRLLSLTPPPPTLARLEQTMQGLLNLIIFLRTPGVMEEWRDEVQKINLSFRRASTVDSSALLSSGPRSDEK